jgi:hypothetical protein
MQAPYNGSSFFFRCRQEPPPRLAHAVAKLRRGSMAPNTLCVNSGAGSIHPGPPVAMHGRVKDFSGQEFLDAPKLGGAHA